ncbi:MULTISPECIES: beta-N-acetylglucosaminidase domain-containing protein [Streptomyces]|uniref:Beta-N-acetylglucosaminidase domain-containing protein n=1 Tax=Streptomyces glycanivorans TaxID=3033808 RepID=A0ABY9J730_9ACTN|nr:MULTISPECIES: beta-N-acetylglucosaminidase domain-containing protein [unclassified Streptomyces]WLQ63605.1 beta-N-acetylglucosaminidase domain-containing protein [Streptomyces sp. Alt3]WSQ76989.1 beta-N-acetylglucosaminidase domain-containing protein [Streptomyces sp. NBC_01213]WSQ84318.1 beta-N-acetylglucosaminidase domain-containing protein [Streptomyces sp. NBC_01212]
MSDSHPYCPPRVPRLPLLGAAALLALGTLSAPAWAAGGPATAPAPTTSAATPVVTPTPQHMESTGRDLRVPDRVRFVLGDDVDAASADVIRKALTSAGARHIETVPASAAVTAPSHGAKLTVVAGSVKDRAVAAALRAAGGTVPGTLVAEGYSLASRGNSIVLAGNDGDGVYYAAQTLRQLVTGKRTVASVSITDHPAMPLRGSIEGFYGAPWSHADRLDQLAFYGDIKANTYIYTPKDDAYLRDEWRDPYPADKLADLRELIDQATAHHVDFTYALSPGLSVCYSDPGDVSALKTKLGTLYDQGARSFYVALDDISYTKWNCEADQEKYGAPGRGSAGQAQADLLNSVQHDFIDARPDAAPLQFVPTEYSDTADSAYKSVLREQLDPKVVVQWTGTDVVPPSISVADAEAASAVWGRKVFLWDNYPVNDYGQTTGRLLMAPYDKREAGLHKALSGIVLNPMNQAAASKVALFGGASFAWNDEDYDPDRTWRAAAGYLAGGDPATTRALLAFFDTQHLAPTFGDTDWQPQAPELAARLADFTEAWDSGSRARRQAALRELGAYADVLAGAPEQIRAGVRDPAFLAQTKPWLDSLDAWGGSLDATLDGLRARLHSGSGQADFAEAADLAKQAAAYTTIPGTTRPQGTIKVADGVLDTFIQQAPTM